MRYFHVLGAFAQLISVSHAATCAADNCYRAILGTTKSQSSSRASECARFLQCTSYASTSTAVAFTSVASTTTSTPTSTSVVTSTPILATTTMTITPPAILSTTTFIPDPTTITSILGISAQLPNGIAVIGKRQNLRRQGSPSSGLVCPTSATPTYAKSCSNFSRYSSACSCAGMASRGTVTSTPLTTSTSTIVTTTVTTTAPTFVTTSTTTVAQDITTIFTTLDAAISIISQVAATPTIRVTSRPSLCGNAGLKWAYFEDDQSVNTDGERIAYDPTQHKQEPPQFTLTTTQLGYDSDLENGIYGSGLSPVTFAIELVGYIFAPEDGVYTFSASNVDDVLYMWVGPTAYAGWSKLNAAQFVYGDEDIPGVGRYTTTFTLNKYYAFRLVYKQGAAHGAFQYTITAPSGLVIVDGTPRSSPNLVQYSCDNGVLAPPFFPFGAET